ncbi:MAG: response regulator [Polyangiaceae bacterium]|nr:response regulator [Polyangiaceae bacterium]
MVLRRFGPAFRPKEDGATGGRILYVEDDDANWRITERYLRGKYDLRRAKNSREALELVCNGTFHLILLDIELAGSEHDGIEICRILRGIAPMPWGFGRPAGLDDKVPIVVVTAYVARYPREELLTYGCNEVVTKPVEYTRLLLVSSRLIVRELHDSAPAASSKAPGISRPPSR